MKTNRMRRKSNKQQSRNKKETRHNRNSRKHMRRYYRLKGGESVPASVSNETIGEFSAGELMTKTSPNFMERPDLFPEGADYVKMINAHGLRGGNKLVGLSNTGDVLPSDIVGPKSGPPMHSTYTAHQYDRPLSLGTGPQAQVLQHIGGKKMYRKKSKKVRFSKRKASQTKKNKKSRNTRKNHKKSRRSQMHKLRGGYKVPYSNEPISFGYSLGGELPDNHSGLANPPPTQTYRI